MTTMTWAPASQRAPRPRIPADHLLDKYSVEDTPSADAEASPSTTAATHVDTDAVAPIVTNVAATSPARKRPSQQDKETHTALEAVEDLQEDWHKEDALRPPTDSVASIPTTWLLSGECLTSRKAPVCMTAGTATLCLVSLFGRSNRLPKCLQLA
jgi:hypothetical protein